MADSITTVPLAALGEAAPDFVIGQNATLSDFRGQPVVLAFFPSDWDPSRPHQLALYDKLFGKLAVGSHIVGVAAEDDWCEVDLSADRPVRFPLLHKLSDRPDIARLYGVEGRQALFVLDADGVVTWLHISASGFMPTASELERALKGAEHGGLSRRQFLVAAAAVSFAVALLPRLGKAQTETPQAQVSTNITLRVNGQNHTFEADSRTTVLDALRERIGLTGTKKGCDHGQCGACTIHVNGRRANACLMLAKQAEGAEITTVEGLAHGDKLHPVQAAFIKHDGFQCGYCTSGQIMSGVACIHEGHAGSNAEIKEWMSGNICRCGAYVGICDAIAEANSQMGGRK
jgi:xanthine dehydrogenase YagT iron-sulfur-binding subunit